MLSYWELMKKKLEEGRIKPPVIVIILKVRYLFQV